MQPITLEVYLPLTKESCSTLLSDMQVNIRAYLKEQSATKKTTYIEDHAIAEFYQNLAYQKNVLNNGEKKTFLEELLSLDFPNSLEELLTRSYLLTRISCFIDTKNIDIAILNTPQKYKGFPFVAELEIPHILANPNSVGMAQSYRVYETFLAQMTQDTLVELFHTMVLNPKKSLLEYAKDISKSINETDKIENVLKEFFTEFSFNNLRSELAVFAIIPVVFNEKQYNNTQIENFTTAFYNVAYSHHEHVDFDGMRNLLIQLSTKFFDLDFAGSKSSKNTSKSSKLKFINFDDNLKDTNYFVRALQFFRNEKMFKHLLPYQNTLALYKDMSLKIKDKSGSKSTKNKI